MNPLHRFQRGIRPGYNAKGGTGQRMEFARGASFNPQVSGADLISTKELERQIAEEGIWPLAEATKRTNPKQGPMRIVQVGYPGLITAGGIANAIQITPRNPDRWSLLICNPSNNGSITFSYGAPNASQAANIALGAGIPAGLNFSENAGMVSINAIYVWSDAALGTFPIPVIVYEGVPWVETTPGVQSPGS